MRAGLIGENDYGLFMVIYKLERRFWSVVFVA